MKQSFAMKVLFLSFALQDIVGYNGRTGLVTRNELLLKVNIQNNKNFLAVRLRNKDYKASFIMCYCHAVILFFILANI